MATSPARTMARRWRGVLAGFISLSVAAAFAAAAPNTVRAAPQPGYGQIVSSSPLPAAQAIPGAASSSRIVYRTADGSGAPRVSSAALYLPAGAPRAVVSWAHGANGLGDQCAPTVRGRPDRESRYFRSLLAAGLAVVATDYIGLGTPGPSGFLDSVGEANAVADAARATRHLQPSVDSWIADGHSQGAHATFNAAAHGPGHAPELRYLGAAATSFPPQVDALIPLMTPTTPPLPLELTGLYLMALRGFSAIHPDLHVEDHLSTLGKRLFRTNDTKCIDAINDAARGVPISATLRTPLSASTIEAFQRYLRLPVRGIDRPLFLGAGLRDQTLPYPAVLPAVAALRANGVDARFHTYDAGHDDIIEISLRDRLSFVTGLAR